MWSDMRPAGGGPVIVAEHLAKRYWLGGAPYGVLRDSLAAGAAAVGQALRGRRLRRDRPSLWALDDVSLEVPEGEVLGVIGRNGSGKSTLLKVLARITEPTRGHATVRGRVGALLEVGSGIHPELNGRENIFINGSMLGMRRREIVRRFDEIVAFAGVDAFLETPVKHYSSGMQMRLAFAVAAHLDAHILLVDEVLAVGDSEFQQRCLGKMEEVSRDGRTVLLVSHQMSQIRRLCRSVAWFDRGRLRMLGPADETIQAYEAASATPAALSGESGFLGWSLGDGSTFVADGAAPCSVHVRLALAEAIGNGELRVVLRGQAGEVIAGWSFDRLHLDPGAHDLQIALPHLPLRPGTYTWRFTLFDGGTEFVGGRLLEDWYAAPPLGIGGVTWGHARDHWGGWLNVPATLRSGRIDERGTPRPAVVASMTGAR